MGESGKGENPRLLHNSGRNFLYRSPYTLPASMSSRKPPPPKGNEKSPGLPGLNSLHLEIHRLSSLVAVMTIEVYGPLNQGTNFGGIDIVDGDHTAKSLLDKELGFITTLTLKHITSE